VTVCSKTWTSARLITRFIQLCMDNLFTTNRKVLRVNGMLRSFFRSSLCSGGAGVVILGSPAGGPLSDFSSNDAWSGRWRKEPIKLRHPWMRPTMVLVAMSATRAIPVRRLGPDSNISDVPAQAWGSLGVSDRCFPGPGRANLSRLSKRTRVSVNNGATPTYKEISPWTSRCSRPLRCPY
jgi:hypothetical protein